jgi:phosphoribosylglycinamide formyltransferase 2
MGVALVNDTLETPITQIIEKAKEAAALIHVNP